MRTDQKNQAFPDENNFGISMRDYFAIRALPLAIQMRTDTYNKEMKNTDWHWDIEDDVADFAYIAYTIADAMLQVRDQNL